MIFAKRKTNAALQQFTKAMWQQADHALLLRVFYKWDKFETTGRTFVRTFILGVGRFYGAGKELLPCANWNISNQIPINFQRCSKVADVFV